MIDTERLAGYPSWWVQFKGLVNFGRNHTQMQFLFHSLFINTFLIPHFSSFFFFVHSLFFSVVPFGKNNIYTMPCDITFWGKQENEQEVIQRMRRHGYMLRIFREPIPSKSGMPGNSVAAMGVGRPPSIKISQDQVLRCVDINFI